MGTHSAIPMAPQTGSALMAPLAALARRQQLDGAVVPSLDAGGQLQATAEGCAAHRYLFVRAWKDGKSGLLVRQAIAHGRRSHKRPADAG